MKKLLVVGIIVLFIGVGVQPAFAIETESSVDNIEKKEDCDCQGINGENDVICIILWIRHTILSLRAYNFWKLTDTVPYGGILYSIYCALMNLYNDRADGIGELAEYYKCEWPQPMFV